MTSSLKARWIHIYDFGNGVTCVHFYRSRKQSRKDVFYILIQTTFTDNQIIHALWMLRYVSQLRVFFASLIRSAYSFQKCVKSVSQQRVFCSRYGNVVLHDTCSSRRDVDAYVALLVEGSAKSCKRLGTAYAQSRPLEVYRQCGFAGRMNLQCARSFVEGGNPVLRYSSTPEYFLSVDVSISALLISIYTLIFEHIRPCQVSERGSIQLAYSVYQARRNGFARIVVSEQHAHFFVLDLACLDRSDVFERDPCVFQSNCDSAGICKWYVVLRL